MNKAIESLKCWVERAKASRTALGYDGTILATIGRMVVDQWSEIAPNLSPDERPKCSLCGLEDGACICRHIPAPQPDAAVKALVNGLKSARHALRSYQYGNSSPALAEEQANHLDKILAKVALLPENHG